MPVFLSDLGIYGCMHVCKLIRVYAYNCAKLWQKHYAYMSVVEYQPFYVVPLLHEDLALVLHPTIELAKTGYTLAQ